MHGGRVSAASDGAGKGAELGFRLPLAVPAAPTPIGRGRAGRGRADARRVLVIEDNADAGEMLREFLALEGHEVRLLRSGERAVEEARSFLPDLLLCDIGLPGLDGFAVARALRAEKDLEGIALVALTGYGASEDRRRALEAGFVRHLTKPIDPDALTEILRAETRRPPP